MNLRQQVGPATNMTSDGKGGVHGWDRGRIDTRFVTRCR